MKKTSVFLLSLLSLFVSCNTTTSSEISSTHRQEETESKTRVILLAGGDNCLGYSYSYHLQDFNMDISDQKMQEYRDGYDNVKILYKNMLSTHVVNRENENFENVRLGLGKVANESFSDGIIGPELGIAEYLTNYYCNDNIYILKFAGASSSTLRLEWNPNGGIYYQKMIDFFDQGLRKISEITSEFEISSFCFIQGESDSKYFSDTYDKYLKMFVNSVKEKYYDYSPSNGMSFIDSGISQYYLNHRVINSIKKDVADSDGRNYYIDPIASDIHNDKDNMDRKHYDAMGMLKLGNIFGRKIKESIEDKNYNVEKDFTSDNLINYNCEFGDYKLSSLSNGEFAHSQWKFTRTNETLDIHVQVEDKYIYEEDGIKVRISSLYDGEGLAYGTYEVNAYHDGQIIVNKYNGYDFVSDDLEVVCKNRYIDNQDKIGYQLSLTIYLNNIDICFAFALVNSNEDYINTKVYDKLKTDFNKSKTFMEINNNILSFGKHVKNGNQFGDAYLFERNGTWDLSKDNGIDNEVILTYPNSDSKIFMYNNDSSKLSVDMKFTALSVANYDYYPKFGIKITSVNGNAVAFYVDAWGDGINMYGCQLGYVTYTNDINNADYTLIDAFVGTNSVAYQNNNYIKLGIIRDNDYYKFTCNDEVVLEMFDPINSGKLPAYMGVFSFNTQIKVKEYNLINL